MCDALRELMREEIEEERRKAEQETLLGTIKNLMANLKMTADQAMSAINIPTEKREEYRMKLQKLRFDQISRCFDLRGNHGLR